MDISKFRVSNGQDFKLSDISTDSTGKIKSKDEGEKKLKENIEEMVKLQDKLYAENKYALLIIFQAMDTAGKDGAIKHVMSGLNPQGTRVTSFKQPSKEEMNHDYLWRVNKYLPERGQIGIFNRSYYEEVLVVKVHDLVNKQNIPDKLIAEDIWKNRYSQIKDYEKYLFENGIIPVKIFLHISKKEQKERLLERIDNDDKNWKFSDADLKERELWNDYQKCYQEAIENTSTKHAPWYVVPADKKWFARLLISDIINKTLESLKLEYPKLNEEQHKILENSKQALLNEKY